MSDKQTVTIPIGKYKNSLKKFSKNISKNPWMISTIILAIILVFYISNGGISSSGSSVSAEEAAQNVLDFANNQGADATLISSKDNGGLYEIVLSIEGQEIPIYATKDGKNLIPQLVPLTGNAPENSPSQAQAQPTPTNIPKSDKPVVELFVMSICPYGTQMEKGILPVLDALGDKIDFELKFVSYAMHDRPEIDENLVQYCVQKEYPEKLKEYLYCYLQENDPSVWNSCISKLDMDKNKIDSCVENSDNTFGVTDAYNDKSSWLSGRYPVFPIDKEDNEKYGVGGSPTLIINGAKANSARDSASLLNAICSAFDTAPEECNQELSSDSFGPGFGFSVAPTSASSSACGAY